MSNSKLDELKSLLQSHNLWAKKWLGQNFLIDEEVLDKIVGAADLKSSDNVVEVGPGTGFLTERLLDKAGHVTAIEYDAGMVRLLNKKFEKNGKNLEIVHSDILKFKIQNLSTGKAGSKFKNDNYKVVANIPYYITSPLLKHFLQSDLRPNLMVLLVQKEVAEKVCGITGKSLITIETQLFGKPEIVDIVPADSFYPAPKVDSAILKIDVFENPLVEGEKLQDFLRVVKFGYSQKRKKLSNTLAAGLRLPTSEMKEILLKVDIDPNLRAENLGVEDWKKLVKLLTKLGK